MNREPRPGCVSKVNICSDGRQGSGEEASTLNEWYRLPLPLVHLPAGVRQLGEHVRALALGEWLKVSNPSVHKVRSLLALAT